MLARLPSGQKLQPSELMAKLRSKRGMTWAAVAVLLLGGGWWYVNDSGPKIAAAGLMDQAAPKPKKTTAAGATAGAAKKAAGDAKLTTTPKNAVAKSGAANKVKATAEEAATAAPTPSKKKQSKPVEAAADESAVSDPAQAIAPAGTAAAASKTQAASPAAAELLASTYIDETNGFSIRFPAGWALRTFSGDPWVLDCGDTRGGLISVGFSPLPSDITAEQLLPEAIARRIKRRPNTTLQGQGRTAVDGKKAIWSKSTGPLPTTTGSPRMTRVQYIVPLQDGRVLELRVAAPPEQFDLVAPVMGKALATFKIIPRTGIEPLNSPGKH